MVPTAGRRGANLALFRSHLTSTHSFPIEFPSEHAMTDFLPSVVVTGAAGGMGVATSALLLERGWRVIAIERPGADFSPLAAHAASERLTLLFADLAAPDLEAHLFPHLDDSLRGLVNLAGISIGTGYADLTDEDWRTSFAVNVDAPMRLCRLIGPRLERLGRGSIVNVSSPVGLIGAKKPSYAASKAALTGLTMTLARSLGPRGVRVNLLLPGTAITGMTADWSQARRNQVAASSWLKRLCQPDEIARVIAFLLSDDASYLTGSIVDMTAGSMHGH
jgi:NAD(P)-dependent dehydrogenase (short-subunit alcohol dehydrogenase family)